MIVDYILYKGSLYGSLYIYIICLFYLFTLYQMLIMKMLRLLTVTLLISFAARAQEVDISRGDLSILKGEKTINVEFLFEKLSVGDFSKEQDYIKKRTEEANAKEPGSGDIWARKWQEDKDQKFGPKFIFGFTKEADMTVSKDAKYTLIFNTTAIEPGYSVGVSKRNAGVDGQVWIVETANKAKKLVVLSVERPGENMWRGAAFDAGSRIADAYFLDGQKVGKFVKKNSK
jgi:hypothetical protein